MSLLEELSQIIEFHLTRGQAVLHLAECWKRCSSLKTVVLVPKNLNLVENAMEIIDPSLDLLELVWRIFELRNEGCDGFAGANADVGDADDGRQEGYRLHLYYS